MKKQSLNSLFSVLLIATISSCFILNGQTKQGFYETLNSEATKYSKINKLDSIILAYESATSDSLEYVLNDYAYWLFDHGEEHKAISAAEKSAFYYSKNGSKDIRIGQLNQFDLAYYYSTTKNVSESIRAHRNVLKINDTNTIAALSYFELGQIYSDSKNYYQALDYYKLVGSLLREQNTNIQVLRNAYQNLSYLGYKIETKKSIAEGCLFGEKADSLAQLIDTSIEDQFSIKLNMAYLHVLKNDMHAEKEARFYFDQGLILAKTIKDSSKIARVYQGLGDLYNVLDTTKSLTYFKKAIVHTQISDTILMSDLNNGLGHTYSIMRQYENSILHREKALALLTGHNLDNLINLDFSFYTKFEHNDILLWYLSQFGETYLKYYNETKKESLLQKSRACFALADKIVNLLKTSVTDFKSRYFWQKLSSNLYDKAIQAAFILGNKDEVFYYMEKNKALLLIQDIIEKRLKERIHLSEKQRRKEFELENTLGYIANQIENKTANSKKLLDSLKIEQSRLSLVLETYRDSLGILRKDFEISPEISKLWEVQRSLQKNETILEYYISQKDENNVYDISQEAYLLAISKEDVQYYKLADIENIKSLFERCLELLKRPFNSQEDRIEYLDSANTLYKHLIPDKALRKKIKSKKLIVVPEGFLSFFPFEALVVDKNTPRYLIEDNSIQYAYSNSFLKNLNEPSTVPNPNFLAIAPVEFDNLNLASLGNSVKEVERLSKYYEGKAFIYEEASKLNFFKSISDAHILHLATHANAGMEENPWIAFHDQKIGLNDLYSNSSHADLIVLSACNTSSGKYEIGEGVMSLARGFFYTGAQSTVSSLWNINDHTTVDIMSDFYKNLSKGQPKSEAIRNAKLTYIRTKSLSEASPYYWAPLILTGSDHPLPNSSQKIYYLAILFFLIVLSFTMYWVKRKRKTKN